jgi:hypothetical protein
MKKRADLELFALGLLLLVVAIVIPTETETCSTNGFGQFCTQTIYTYDGVSAQTAKVLLFVVAALCLAGGAILLILRNTRPTGMSTGQHTASMTASPPGRNSSPTPAPSGGATESSTSSTPPSSPLAPAGVPLEAAAPPKQKRHTKLLVSVGSAIVLLALIGVWIGAQAQAPSTAFQQEVTTGSHITSIEVGTGILNSGLVQGQADTFQAGKPSCISVTVHNGSSPGYIDAVLFQGSNTFFSGSVIRGLNPYWQGPFYICSSNNVLDSGVYKWVVNYNGSAEASITFQVVS